MDHQRFDQLTRVLGQRASRRYLALLATAGIGLQGSQPARGQTLGKRRCGRKRCKKKHVCFRKKCRHIPVAGRRCFSAGLPCRNGAICVATGLGGGEVCVCPAGTSACGAYPGTACVNLHSDPFHCGSCFNRCLAATTTCCAAGLFDPGECVDTSTDARHCGGCGQPCPTGAPCVAGVCQAPGCVEYGGACSSEADCCLVRQGTHIPCIGGLCRFG
jgi:hypothetical protein